MGGIVGQAAARLRPVLARPGCRQASGSGIGLAVAAELARIHGGTLTAASQPGEGTRLTLILPGA
ncbi:MAG TPA: ATP-binding protein [Trebonia sp.]